MNDAMRFTPSNIRARQGAETVKLQKLTSADGKEVELYCHSTGFAAKRLGQFAVLVGVLEKSSRVTRRVPGQDEQAGDGGGADGHGRGLSRV